MREQVRACAEKTTESTDKCGNGVEAQGTRPRGAPKKRWRDLIKKDFAEAEITAEDAVDRQKWRRLTRTADLATARDQR
uniref:Endonuclease-reverse transcriptase HmRTE-e01 n=1 Tax=Haemonchus contortus TaxID=6289 RepID=W6NBE8_HAECO